MTSTSHPTPLMANAIRALSMDAVEKAQSGHPGMPMGMADVATVLFANHLKFNPKDPKWADRDRFILSAGHGSMLLYSLLYLTGYEDISLDDIKNFRQLGSKTAGHPEYGELEGIETTTGPLGQGLANAVGFALAERLLNARYGDDLVNHRTYVIAGDGCLMEGISQEAISLAGHLNLKNLIVLFDDNGISIDGPTSLSTSDDTQKRFESAGWEYLAADGHDMAAVDKAICAAKNHDKPTIIACKTTIGYGAPTKAGKSSSHGSPLGKDEIAGARAALGWDHPAFEIPQDILNQWASVADRAKDAYNTWQDALNASPKKSAFTTQLDTPIPASLSGLIEDFKAKMAADKIGWATRKSSGEVLAHISDACSTLIGGSADLTGSNLTKHDGLTPISRDDFSGSYVYYGIREHAMASAMNGIALHGGLVPFGGTFMVFTDYCRPAIRLSALMKQRVVYVMTHDSIGLGEDGPTHQPVEHLASLRAIPNLNVFRPADVIETAESWQIALESSETPSILALTRQGVPCLRDGSKENLTRKGAYILREADGDVDVTLIATGSEVSLAVEARDRLQAEGIGVRVISMPCWELFQQQSSDYFVSLFCNKSIKIGIEAAGRMGWERYIGPHGTFIGVEGFGASGPAEELYKHFGITTDAIVARAQERLAKKAA